MESQLYLRQLFAGRDFAQSDPIASQMQNFVYLIGDRATDECVVVDPAWDVPGIVQAAEADGMTIKGVMVTHYHPDHVGGDLYGHTVQGVVELLEHADCPIHVHKKEAEFVTHMTGIGAEDMTLHESGDVVKVGGIDIQCLHTPGHTPGSMCFRCKNTIIAGDTLFLQGCGRTDLPGGDSDEMYRTLNTRLSTLPKDTILYPGHNYGGASAPMSQVYAENSYMRVPDLATWRRFMR